MKTRFKFRVHHLKGYMHRWLFSMPWGGIRLHHILRSDNDRHLHDHPWDFVSILLSSGYTEHTVNGSKYWPRFSIIKKKAEDRHRLELQNPIWTLVFTKPKRRDWGFWTENGFVHWRNYTEADYEMA